MAIHAAGSTDRAKVREAMENLGPFEGAVRAYERPVTRERHEALSADDVFFARYERGRGLAPLAR
jgi:branched-chain amino acid transport system substrate-binding protein